MSSNVDLGTDTIQHIDDACDEEYIEGFAPKAQEEILSETQDSNQGYDSNKNTTEEYPEKSESEDVSNEEINEASNELVKDVITDVESEVIHEDELNKENDDEEIIKENTDELEVIKGNDEDELEIHAEISQDSELNAEIADVDEADVVMKEPEADIVMNEPEAAESETEEKNVENEEAEQQVVEEEPVVVSENSEENAAMDSEPNAADEPAPEEPETEQLTSTDLADQKLDDANEIIEEPVAEKTEPVEEVVHDAEINDSVDVTPHSPPTEHVEEATNTSSSSPKAKDVKSLSSTYGHEDSLANGDCCICNKIVYPMEKLATNDRLFHKTCFRCTKCKNALSAGNFTFNHGKPYCTPHYVELFKKRGRYDEVDDNTETENSTTTDVNDVLTDELPAPDTTKNILAKFRDLETGGGNNANQSAVIDSSDELPAPNTTKNLMERFTALGQEKSDTKCKPKIDIPRHSNGHSNGTSENEPVVLKDVIRSNDPSQDDKPEQGITKNLVNQFRKMESSANN